MNIIVLLALLLTIAGWVLTGMTGMNLLSGYLEDRTCQTDCVQSLFYAAVVTGFAGLFFSLIGAFRSNGGVLRVITLLLAVPLSSIFVVLYIAGNYV